ncbi:MAG: hypothetical protein QOF02_2524 [Blastocatellia bacterium]|jgi:hypothetical protein|nr:hypothetical protein [Blastocatellia bacterium]
MKICPTCNRTYADETLTFCLDDGSTLSAPYDRHKTERISASRRTDGAPTEVLYPEFRADDLTPSLPPTIASPQPPIYPEKQSPQPQEKRSNRTGLVLVMGVILGVVLAAVIGIWLGASNNNAVDNRNTTDNRAQSNISNSNKTAPSTLTELPGKQWRECEATGVGGVETCGDWSRQSTGRWLGQWGEVKANLEITVEGKNVTVRRREITSSLEATYRGALNPDRTQITGTVDWCCDAYGDRSGTWHANYQE